MKLKIAPLAFFFLLSSGCTKAPEANKENCSRMDEILPALTEVEVAAFQDQCRSHNAAEHMSETYYEPPPQSPF